MQAFSVSLSKNAPYGMVWNAPSPLALIGTPPAAVNSGTRRAYFTSSGTRTLG